MAAHLALVAVVLTGQGRGAVAAQTQRAAPVAVVQTAVVALTTGTVRKLLLKIFFSILKSCENVTYSENTGRGSGVRGLRCRGRALLGGRAAARTGGLCRRRGPPSGGRWSAQGATSLSVPVIWPLGVSI